MKPIRCLNSNDQHGNFREDKFYLLYFTNSHGHIICDWKGGKFTPVRSGILGGFQQGKGNVVFPFRNSGCKPTRAKKGCQYLTFEMSNDEYLTHVIAEEL
jgi:hypothetical protein